MSLPTDHTVFLLLGSNQENPIKQLEMARDKLEDFGHQIVKCSSLFKTAPWGITHQPDFYNQVVQIHSHDDPHTLLQHTQAIELQMGRVRKQKWGPRIIDIDILFFDDRIVNSLTLCIPHPQICNRRFTLEPLAEIAPEFTHPVLRKTLKNLLMECEDTSPVEKLSPKN